jgi:hypothetical protein
VERICGRSSGGLRPISGQDEEIKVIKSNIGCWLIGDCFIWIIVYTEFPLLSKQIFNKNLPKDEKENVQ